LQPNDDDLPAPAPEEGGDAFDGVLDRGGVAAVEKARQVLSSFPAPLDRLFWT